MGIACVDCCSSMGILHTPTPFTSHLLCPLGPAPHGLGDRSLVAVAYGAARSLSRLGSCVARVSECPREHDGAKTRMPHDKHFPAIRPPERFSAAGLPVFRILCCRA